MSNAAEFPLWAAILVAFFVLLGSSLALIGTIGFARLQSFYERLHAPTLGTSWGTGGIVMASIIYFSVSGQRPVFHEIFIGLALAEPQFVQSVIDVANDDFASQILQPA